MINKMYNDKKCIMRYQDVLIAIQGGQMETRQGGGFEMWGLLQRRPSSTGSVCQL